MTDPRLDLPPTATTTCSWRSALLRAAGAALFVMSSASSVMAQRAIVPYAGAAFGGSIDSARSAAGVSVQWPVLSWVAVEADLAWTANPLRIEGITAPLFDDGSVSTFMGNAMIGLPTHWSSGRVHPFGVVGLGAMHTRVGDDTSFVHFSNTHLGMDVGGGATVNLGQRFGLRGDVRYLRDLQTLESDSEFFSLSDTHLSFWRSTAGLVIRF